MLKVFVGRGDDPHVGLERRAGADPRELAVLKDPEDFALEGEGHVADFIQEKGAAVALLEPADALRDRPGERPFFVAEKLALEQLLRDGCAIDRHKVAPRPAGEPVDRAGGEFLARAALASDHDRRVGVGDAPDHLEDVLHRRGLADDGVLVLLDGELRLEGGGGPHFGLLLERGIDDGLEVEGERLLAKEIEGAELHRFDHGLRGSVGAGEDDHGVRVALTHLYQQL